jgi:triacylglycerol esterase/lipase EstA (alpha/beta hydrolase family)
LLVPGGAGEYGVLYFLERFLRQRGWQSARFCPQSWKGSLEDQSRNLARAVEHACQSTQSERIRIVAFGRGGLLASWYVQYLDGSDRIQRLVTIGTAWSGTRMAVFRNATARRDLQLNNARLDGLSPPNVSTVCIWSADDPEVIPPQSAVIDHGTDPIAIAEAGHYEMLISARVYRTVDMALERQGKPAAVANETPT